LTSAPATIRSRRPPARSRRLAAAVIAAALLAGGVAGDATATVDEALERELGGPLAGASPKRLTAAVANVIDRLGPAELHQAVDIIAAAAAEMPDRAAVEALVRTGREAVRQVAAAHPGAVEDWWLRIIENSLGTAAIESFAASRHGADGEPPAIGLQPPRKPEPGLADLRIVPVRRFASGAGPAEDGTRLGVLPPPPPARVAPDRAVSSRPANPIEGLKRDARGLFEALSGLLTSPAPPKLTPGDPCKNQSGRSLDARSMRCMD